MNYIKLIRFYWDEAPYMDGYKPDYTALFFAIVDEINRNKWQETAIEYGQLIEKTKLGKRMYLEARKWLAANGLIAMTEGRGDYAKAKFNVGIAVQKYTALCTASTEDQCNTAPHSTPHSAPHTAPIYKGINLKTLKLLNITLFAKAHKVATEPKVEEARPVEDKKQKAPQVAADPQKKAKPVKVQPDPEFPEEWTAERRDSLMTWLHYKSQRKEFYVEDGLRALITKLSKFSDYVVEKAIENSMSNNYAGLFPDKIPDHANGTNQQRTNGSYNQQRSNPGPNRKVPPKVDLEAALRRRRSSNGNAPQESVSAADWRYVDEPVVPARS